MFVKVAADGSVSLEDRDNFRAFKLVVEGGPARLDQARRALAAAAELPDQSTAWIFEKALRDAPRRSPSTSSPTTRSTRARRSSTPSTRPTRRRRTSGASGASSAGRSAAAP
jgi:hypothetical protein